MLISAKKMLDLTDKNRGNNHTMDLEQLILNAALRGEDCIEFEYLKLDKKDKIELVEAGYELSETPLPGDRTRTYISWKLANGEYK